MRRLLHRWSLLFIVGLGAVSPAAAAAPDWITPGIVPPTETVTLRNAACEAVVLVKPFVRLIGFRLAGGRSHLIDFSSPNPVRGGRLLRPLYVVGGRLWPSPDMPDFYKFGLLPGHVEKSSDREVEVSLGPDPGSGLAARIRFSLDADAARLVVTTRLRNAGAMGVRTGCWWPVAFEPGGKMESDVIPSPGTPRYPLHSWAGDNPPSDPPCRIDGAHLTLDLDCPLKKDLFEVSFLGREIVVAKPDSVYRLTVLDPLPEPSAAYPSDGSSAILYRDQRTWFCEAELLGPLARLGPGDETAFTFALALEKPAAR